MTENRMTLAEESTDLTKLLAEIEGVADRPASLAPSTAGTEDIGIDDVRLPRLAIAQGLSPQLDSTGSMYVEGLKSGDLFNDLTGTIYGRGPLKFVPVRRDVRRIEFRPRSEGGGVIDLNVPANDPRTRGTLDADGRTWIPPAATRFTEFVVLLVLPKGIEPIVLSIKETNKFNRFAAQQLTMFTKLRATGTKPGPMWSGLYSVRSATENTGKGPYGVYVVKNNGWIPIESPVGKALFDQAEAFAESIKGKEIVVEREPGTDDDLDFGEPGAMGGKSEM